VDHHPDDIHCSQHVAWSSWQARLSALIVIAAAAAAQPPVIPTGLDTYRLWTKWPYQRIGMRAYMRSTYDRNGNNERADAAHTFYISKPPRSPKCD
jgi:hypothetical protein